MSPGRQVDALVRRPTRRKRSHGNRISKTLNMADTQMEAANRLEGTAVNPLVPASQSTLGGMVAAALIGLAFYILNLVIIYMVLKAAIRNAMIEAYDETGRT